MTNMKELGEMIESDEELQRMIEELHDLTGYWSGYNFDEYAGVEDYKRKLKEKLEKLKTNGGSK